MTRRRMTNDIDRLGQPDSYDPRDDYNRWGHVGARFKATEDAGAFHNEIRWGDAKIQELVIPAASVAPVSAVSGVQYIDVREKPRTWNLSLNVLWLNPDAAAATPADAPVVGFIITLGVGSATQTRFVNLGVNTLLASNFVDIPNLPAATILVAGTVTLTPAAGAARTYHVQSSAMIAPMTRS